MSAGVNDPAKFILKFYKGTFTGLDQNGIPFNGIDEALTQPILVVQSPEFNNVSELNAWMTNDFTFNENFKTFFKYFNDRIELDDLTLSITKKETIKNTNKNTNKKI